MSLERRDKDRQQRLQPLAADSVARLPQDDQRLFHSLVVDPEPSRSPGRHQLRSRVQQSDRMLAVVARDGHELVQNAPLVSCRCLPVPLRNRLHQLLILVDF